MSDGELGYKRPPKTSRFKPGVSGNPKGRPKRQNPSLAEIVVGTLAMPVQHRDRDRTTSTPLKDLGIKAIVNRAVEGNLDAAELLLKIRAHAAQHGDAGWEELWVADWLPGSRGQTAEQKTAEFAATGEAAPAEWWEKPPSRITGETEP
jgi:hypothetical protein